MPSLYKNRAGVFQAEIWIDGRRISRTTGSTSRREAERRAAELEAEARQEWADEADAGASLALNDVAGRYMTQVGDHHAGADNTRRLVGWLVNYFGPAKRLTDITHDAVLTMRNQRRADKVGKAKTARAISNATVNDTVEQLKKLYTYLKRAGVKFKREPAWSSLWLDEQAEHVRLLSEDEEHRLYAALRLRPDYVPLISFLHGSGKRKTNCFTLRWSQVNWQRNRITMTVKGRDGGRKVEFEIKPAMRSILRPLFEARRENCGVPEAADYVFTFTAARTVDKVIKGKRQCFVAGKRYPITKDGLRRVWDTICKEAQLVGSDRLRIHDLRHDFASKLLASVPTADGVRIVQGALDHAPGSTTWMKYAHALEGATADAVEALAQSRAKARMAALSGVSGARGDKNPRSHPRSARAK